MKHRHHFRKHFTVSELATYFHKHRNTMRLILKEYGVDLEDAASVIDFIVHFTPTNAQSKIEVALDELKN